MSSHVNRPTGAKNYDKSSIIRIFVIFIMLCLSIGLSFIISGASYTLGAKQPDSEKVSVYEYGFDQFESSRISFSVRFFDWFFFYDSFFLT